LGANASVFKGAEILATFSGVAGLVCSGVISRLLGFVAVVEEASAANADTVNKESGNVANQGRLMIKGLRIKITVGVKKLQYVYFQRKVLCLLQEKRLMTHLGD
jgi:hypothetical protein